MAKQAPIVTIITANKLTPSQRAQVQSVVEKKIGRAQYNYTVDPEVIGGIRMTIGNQSFDATIAGELADLTPQLPEVTIITAVKLTKDQLKKIETAVEKKVGSARYSEVIDPSVIGGLMLIIDDEEYDGTIQGKLKKLRTSLLQNI